MEAARDGRTDEVRRLLPLSDPKYCDSAALYWASANGHAECVQLLLPATDPVHYPRALDFAAMEGRTDCVKILMGVVSTDERSKALRTASRYSRHDVVDVFFEASAPDTALTILMEQHPNTPQYWQHLKDKVEVFTAQQQKQVLQNEIGHSGMSVVRKM